MWQSTYSFTLYDVPNNVIGFKCLKREYRTVQRPMKLKSWTCRHEPKNTHEDAHTHMCILAHALSLSLTHTNYHTFLMIN